MKIEAILWTGTAVFFAVVGGVYLAVSGEAAGAALLLVGTVFGALVAGWLWRAVTAFPPRAEDVADADMADEAITRGDLRHPQPPAAVAGTLAVTMLALGLVVGLWLSGIGLGFGLVVVFSMALDAPSGRS